MCEPLNRILSLRGDVDEKTAGDIIDNILQINREATINNLTFKEPIYLHIQSGGGSVPDSHALADIILTSEIPVYTYCDGYVESCAVNIYVAGVKRFAYKHSTFLIHNMKSCMDNYTTSNVQEYLSYLNMLEQYDAELLLERTNITSEELINWVKHNVEYRFDVNDALKHGIVTDIIG